MVFFNSAVVYQNATAFERRFKLHPLVQNLVDNVLIYIKYRFKKDLGLRITSTVSTPDEDSFIHRHSTTHQEGRAFDLSIRNFTEDEITELKLAFTQVAGHLGAWVEVEGERGHLYRCLIKDHDTGLGRHLHFQIGKDIAQTFKD